MLSLSFHNGLVCGEGYYDLQCQLFFVDQWNCHIFWSNTDVIFSVMMCMIPGIFILETMLVFRTGIYAFPGNHRFYYELVSPIVYLG